MADKKTYIIAEIGPNHNGSLERALFMIGALSEIGVDAVKFQISKPENAYSKDAFKPRYQKENEGSESPLEMSKKLQLSFDEHIQLQQKCKQCGVDYLCTAFEMESLRFLAKKTEMPFFKVPSGEILSIDLLEFMGSQNKPIILSTGMASYEEIRISLDYLRKAGANNITVLHCVSNYPTPSQEVNLNVMLEIERKFDVPVGFSDHTLGNDAAIAAVAMGAQIIEKHVTFDKDAEGPDHQASATIEQFSSLVDSIRNVDIMLGIKEKSFSEDELEVKKSARKSIVTTRDLPEGHIISREDLCFKRPGFGFYPTQISKVLGKRIVQPIEENRVILDKHLS